MKTALFNFFLLFALSTQHLSLAQEEVYDAHGHPLDSSLKYHIVPASDKNNGRGIELAAIGSQSCDHSVVVGEDPKWMKFHPLSGESSILTDQPLNISFVQVPECAASRNLAVEIHGKNRYYVLVGPPAGKIAMPGAFYIKKVQDKSHTYTIAFRFYEVDEHPIVTQNTVGGREIVRLDLCGNEKATEFMFYPASRPVPPSPPPAPAPAPTPTSTFEPLIRKRVA